MSMRHLINIVEGFASEPAILMEAQNYEELFNGILRASDGIEDLSHIRENVPKTIADAKATFKRLDRISWYLRLYRLYYLCQIREYFKRIEPLLASDEATENQTGLTRLELSQRLAAFAKLQQRLEPDFEKFGLSPNATSTILSNGITRTRTALEHFFSLGIHAIDAYSFTNQSVHAINDTFREMEQKWQREAKATFPHSDQKVILEFPDGFMWVDVENNYCDDEAASMGHCGNRPSRRSGQTLLSLRKIVKRGEQKFWRPSLTFIREADGTLGEMKGRANEKPKAIYHPHIIALLLLKIDGEYFIKGITGGGYEASKNFATSDLADSEAEELFKKRPELASGSWLYHHEGLTERTKKALEKEYTNGVEAIQEGVDPRWVDKDMIVHEWGEWQDFVRDMGNKSAEHYLKQLEDGYDHYDSSSKDDVVSFLDNLPDETVAKIGEYLAKEYDLKMESDEDSEDDEDDFDEDWFDPTDTSQIYEVMDENSDDLLNNIYSAIGTGYQYGAEKDVIDEFESRINAFSNDRDLMYFRVEFDNAQNKFAYDTKVRAVISAEDIIKLMRDEGTLEQIGYSGWNQDVHVDMPDEIGRYGPSFDDDAALDTFYDMAPSEFDLRPKFRREVRSMNTSQKRLEVKMLTFVNDYYSVKDKERQKRIFAIIDGLSDAELDQRLYADRQQASNKGPKAFERLPEKWRKVILKGQDQASSE